MTLSEEILDKCADVLLEWGNANAEQMRILLRQRLKQKQTESNLAQSIQTKGATVKGKVVTMTIDLNDYWMFVDLGVKGLKNVSAAGVQTKTYTNKDFPQGFSFRNMNTPPQMIDNLQDYIARKGIQVRVSKNQSGAEVIRDSFTMAKSMADAIKKKGIDGTQFYSDTFNQESYNELTNKLSTIIGQEVEFKLITEFKR
jgi:hypothetical protein